MKEIKLNIEKYQIPCVCGSIPEIGMKFWYYSKYGACIEGIIKNIHYGKITSTNGVDYPNEEIELKPKMVLRKQKWGNI